MFKYIQHVIKKPLILLFIVSLLPSTTPVHAQEGIENPIYIIQSGDTLWDIASRFNVDLDTLITANELEDNNLIIGQEIIIPGLEGVSGVLRTETVSYGDNLRSLERRTQASQNILRRLNRLLSPTELYAGVKLIIPVDEEAPLLSARISLSKGETLLEEAIREDSDIWTIAELNTLRSTSSALPGEVLYALANEGETISSANGLPAAFLSVDVENLPFYQGSTAEINVETIDNVDLSGSLFSDREYELKFFPTQDNNFVALQGIHVMTEPGAYPLKLEATYPDGRIESYEQMVLIISAGYPNEIIPVPPETLDPTTREREMRELLDIISQSSSEPLWAGIFNNPSVFEDCFTSYYGSRREYRATDSSTDKNYYSFHSGLDFCGGTGLAIDSAANGIVVFSQDTIIRGSATIIDHGWGIYTGYWHQSENYVQVGDIVEAGEVIGLVGATGRVTGAHLHWEVWVNQVQVNPMPWLEQSFP
ncbi:MAG: LysM peptidoglycan-binding domain-containing protein [Anaerolineae bacterium]|jgi:murein DD-endopeptidase MepM/ murein hydrolase activator NlpD|nr:LysM peptidoglycan-binding domain-containing protein [Anaerolineae bacterium]MBT7075761.1 LysM peptidoglycan-binding domain-containing protein [Anaerolineae bacterium]MBT7783926.1 LysM peptidoglycan-binding domain-containing protein [Anaerolineae bacterium]